MYSLRQKVIWFAFFSRVFILLLQCIANFILPDHDAQDVFRRPLLPNSEDNWLDRVIDILFGGLERWDAHYFLHIAQNGYVYENSVAFFPLFPLAVRFLSACLKIVTFGFLGSQSLLLLASVIMNTVCFIKAADSLFFLSIKVLGDEFLAYKAALLFCINPASIFFSAPYSEALFVLLSFQGMRHSLDIQYSKLCAIPFGLSAAARSNGVLNVGFILHKSIQDFLSAEWPVISRKKGLKNRLLVPFKTVPLMYRIIESCTIALAPFVAYQVYCYVLFCTVQKLNIPQHLVEYAKNNSLVLPALDQDVQRDPLHWCNSKMPLAYSYVQDHYWNVGFLRYFEWKQVPNFILATPILSFIICRSIIFLNQNRFLVLHLGFIPAKVKDTQMKPNSMSPKMFVFVIHALCLAAFCIAFVHIQVATRLICSASPVPYWFASYLLIYNRKKSSNGKASAAAKLISSRLKKFSNKKSEQEIEILDNMNSKWRVIILSLYPIDRTGKTILLYCYLYAIIGSILFSNFLPWT
ncbi:GPI mannosyltransferase 2 [Thrips palmi]|uniref:GPI mannosyltransferase 2 n=1 Tax=Thrips palmi TaxID=161013 RepID=A0A6P8YU86_THRPL|nr:GPI mannosyltransferase 2 [Thrips palmi]